MKKKMRVFVTCLLIVLFVTACGSSSEFYDKNSSVKYEMITEDFAVAEAEDEWITGEFGGSGGSSGTYDGTTNSTEGSSQEILTGEKLVYTCDMTIQTLDYEGCVKAIKENIQAFDGIIGRETESDDAYRWYYEDYVKTGGTRYLYLEVRIPSESYYEFLDSLEGNGKVISKNSYVENISKSYYETDAMIQSLEIQQDRLLEMMEQAKDIEDMITIESRLSDVQYELSLYKNKLASMDADVEYSTIGITVEEVMEYKQDEPIVKTNTFMDRLKNTFAETWEFFLDMLEGMLFLAIRMLPIALVVVVIGTIVRGVILIAKKKKQRKLEELQQTMPSSQTMDKQQK